MTEVTRMRQLFFKRMMRWAYRSEYINEVSYLDRLQIPQDKEKKERIEDKFLGAEDLSKLLHGMEVKRRKLLTEFLAISVIHTSLF